MSARRESRGQRALLERSTLLDEVKMPPLAAGAIAFGVAVVLLFVLWASLASVEEVATAAGTIGAAVDPARIQHPSGGVVADILVREGSEVEAGELVARLESVDAGAALAQNRERRTSLLAQRAKLRALLSGTTPDFKAEGLEESQATADQRRLFAAEIETASAKESILDLQEAQKRAEIEALDSGKAELKAQLDLAREELSIRKGLASAGTVARTQVIAAEREVASLEAALARAPADRARTGDELSEIASRREEYRAERRQRFADELASVNGELAQLDESERRLSHGAGSLELRSPMSGYILGLSVSGKGEVLRAGETFASVIPKEKGYRAELRVSPRDIGSVRPGLPVRLKISAYPFDRFGGFKGRIEEVSASTLAGPDGAPAYRAIATVEGRELKGADALPILPGMTLSAEIVTGERTIMQYILKPIYASAMEAFHER